MCAQARDALGIKLIETTGTDGLVEDKPRVLEHFEVLRDGGTADGEGAGELIDGERPSGELLEDGHAGCIAEGIESGLENGIHRE
jgi:hypothetical protein